MLIVMAVDAEVFPVAAVLGVVMVIAVLVVDGQEVQVFTLKFTAALGADPAVDLEGLFAVTGVCRFIT